MPRGEVKAKRDEGEWKLRVRRVSWCLELPCDARSLVTLTTSKQGKESKYQTAFKKLVLWIPENHP